MISLLETVDLNNLYGLLLSFTVGVIFVAGIKQRLYKRALPSFILLGGLFGSTLLNQFYFFEMANIFLLISVISAYIAIVTKNKQEKHLVF